MDHHDARLDEWAAAMREWRAEKEQTAGLRDQFAAAALTGLLVHANDGIDEETLDTPSDIAYTAYQMADAMLRERGRTNHGAAPAARAEASVKEPMVHATGEPGGEPDGTIGTGKHPAPPCVETDGFSPDSRTGQINRTPECESPRRERGESQRRDVSQPDNGRAAGGPAHHISESELRAAWDAGQASLGLTDAEREAIKAAARIIDAYEEEMDGFPSGAAARLRKLLERLG